MYEILCADYDGDLISEIHRNYLYYQMKGDILLSEAASFSALSCVEALLDGDTSLLAEINRPDPYGRFPLHYAAEILDPSIIELLLYRGAQVDALTVKDKLLPLNVALDKFSFHNRLKEWTDEDSILKLIIVLCLPKMQNQLESIGLLSWTSEKTEEEFLLYASYGMLKEVAALLIVAHKKLTASMQTLKNMIPSLQIGLKEKQNLLLLLEVFRRAGDAIETYVKQEKIGISVDQSVNTVKCLLQEAGFCLEHEDNDLNCFRWYREMGLMNSTECRWKAKDIDMPHYGKSGYRWMVEKLTYDFPIVPTNWTFYIGDDYEKLYYNKLTDIIFNDEKEEMISVILEEDVLRSNGQFLLDDAIGDRAINCIMALVTGDARTTVDVNLPNPLGIFPIHNAASECVPGVIELLLYHGARPDIRSIGHGLLPLHTALKGFIKSRGLNAWNGGYHSIYKLIMLLCQPTFQPELESIALLACSTDETEEEFLRLAKFGRLRELATLLLVNHSSLGGAMQKVGRLGLGLIDDVKTIQDMFLLFKVFRRAGGALEKYIKQDKHFVSINQSVKSVADLLQEAGFPISQEDTNFSGFTRFQESSLDKPCNELVLGSTLWQQDMHMPHYGKSGYRWIPYDKFGVARRVVNDEARDAKELPVVKTMPNEQPNTTKCNNVTTTTRDDGIVGAIRSYVSRTTTNETKARGEIGRKLWINPVLDVSSKRKPRELVVSVIKGVLKRIVP